LTPSHPQQNTILITPTSGAAHLPEQSRRPASNQRAADRAAVDPPFPAKSRSRQKLNGIRKSYKLSKTKRLGYLAQNFKLELTSPSVKKADK